jgi:hypothetical protein
MICRTSSGVLITFKIILNEYFYKKTTRFESKKGLNRRKKRKNVFCKLKSLFLFLLFFHYSFYHNLNLGLVTKAKACKGAG